MTLTFASAWEAIADAFPNRPATIADGLVGDASRVVDGQRWGDFCNCLKLCEAGRRALRHCQSGNPNGDTCERRELSQQNIDIPIRECGRAGVLNAGGT